jgi:hypothetical protein
VLGLKILLDITTLGFLDDVQCSAVRKDMLVDFEAQGFPDPKRPTAGEERVEHLILPLALATMVVTPSLVVVGLPLIFDYRRVDVLLVPLSRKPPSPFKMRLSGTWFISGQSSALKNLAGALHAEVVRSTLSLGREGKMNIPAK